jgi:hypothetical protein
MEGRLAKSDIELVRSDFECLATAIRGLGITHHDLISFDHMASTSFTTLSGIGT